MVGRNPARVVCRRDPLVNIFPVARGGGRAHVNDEFFNFGDFFRAIGSYPWWQVLIELLIIGAVVHWVVSFLQGTRGARLLKGIVVLLITIYVVVRLLAARLGLQRIEFLYGRFLLAAGFAIIVVFQPELRRALMRLGEARIFGGLSPQLH